MTYEEATRLVERVTGHFQMCRQYLNEEAQLAYFELFLPHGFEVGAAIVRDAIQTSDEPWTVARYRVRLRDAMPKKSVIPPNGPDEGPSVEECRSTFRSAMRTSLCDADGRPKNEFAAHVLAQWEQEDERSA